MHAKHWLAPCFLCEVVSATSRVPGMEGGAQLQPFLGDLLGRPLRGHIGPIVEDEAQVIGQRAEPLNIDRHDRGEEHQPVLKPHLAMLVGAAGVLIPAKQHRAEKQRFML